MAIATIIAEQRSLPGPLLNGTQYSEEKQIGGILGHTKQVLETWSLMSILGTLRALVKVFANNKITAVHSRKIFSTWEWGIKKYLFHICLVNLLGAVSSIHLYSFHLLL